MKMKKIIPVLFLLALFSPAFGKDYYFKMMNTHATVLSNSFIDVQENYTYSFDGSFTYVYRSFFLNEIDSVENFRVWNADTGELYSTEISYDSGSVNYRWDISAQDEDQTYVMEYTMVGAIKEFNQTFDSLWYSIVPVDREKRVEAVNFWITFPEEVETSIVSRVSRSAIVTKTASDTILITSSSIPSNTALDAEFYIPNGMVEVYVNPLLPYSIAFGVVSIVLMLLVFYLFIKKTWEFYNEFGRDPMVREFNVVKYLRPAIAGYIYEERADIKEIMATILDLAVRGYIYIREEETGTIFKKKKIWFMKTKEPKGLFKYEEMIMKKLFKNSDKVEVSSLKYKFYKHVPGILKEIDNEVMRQELMDPKSAKIPGKFAFSGFKYTFSITIIPIFFLFLGTFIGLPKLMNYMFLPVILIFFLAFLMILIIPIGSLSMMRKTPIGVAHSKTYHKLKDWMKKYPLKEGRLFDEYLPYATAFGIQAVWVKKLKDLGEEYRSDWYSGAYNVASFTYMTRSISNITASPQSSGGPGGGGFGGGGGAGGGGAGAG